MVSSQRPGCHISTSTIRFHLQPREATTPAQRPSLGPHGNGLSRPPQAPLHPGRTPHAQPFLLQRTNASPGIAAGAPLVFPRRVFGAVQSRNLHPPHLLVTRQRRLGPPSGRETEPPHLLLRIYCISPRPWTRSWLLPHVSQLLLLPLLLFSSSLPSSSRIIGVSPYRTKPSCAGNRCPQRV